MRREGNHTISIVIDTERFVNEKVLMEQTSTVFGFKRLTETRRLKCMDYI